MGNGFQRFGAGFTRAGGGALEGMADQADESAQNIKDSQQQDLNNLIAIMQLKHRLEAKPEEPADTGKWKPIGSTGFIMNDVSGEVKEAFKPPPKEGKQPTNVTGAPSLTGLLTGRRKESEKEVGEFDKQMNLIQSQINQQLGETEPREGQAFDVADDPILSDLLLGAERLGERPQEFEAPTGDPLAALADSVMAARQNPEILAALLGGGAKKKTKKQGKFDDLFE